MTSSMTFIAQDLAGYVARSLVLEFTDQKQGKVLFHHYREGTADYLALLLKHLLSALKAQLIDAVIHLLISSLQSEISDLCLDPGYDISCRRR